MADAFLSLQGIRRAFGACVAVEKASLDLLPGQIHAIVGENGAGKSTLLKIAAGALAPSRGEVLIEGRPLDPKTPAEAMRRGVGMVYQHFMLVSAFRAIENLVLGSEPVGRFGAIDFASAEEKARALMKSAGLEVPLDQITETLSVGERQRLEILRVLYRGARVVLLDEPTAVLSPIEADELYAMLRRLADGGSAIAVVTHRLDEVVRFADRVTVMRRGEVVLQAENAHETKGLTEEALTRAIMGAEPPASFELPKLEDGAEVVLSIRGLSLSDEDGRAILENLDLSIRSGEIVGIAGVEGNGQRELVRAIAGLEDRAAGSITVAGAPLDGPSGAALVRARRRAIGVVHEDRHAEGLVLDATVGDNLVLGDVGDPHAGGFDESAVIARRIKDFGVVPADAAALGSALSGGNQQKLVVARAIDRLTPLGARGALCIAHPSRGVDIGAAATIHEAIGEAAKAGLAVLLLSADLGELKKLCHRLLVMRRGRFVAELPPDASEHAIGRAMLGLEAA